MTGFSAMCSIFAQEIFLANNSWCRSYTHLRFMSSPYRDLSMGSIKCNRSLMLYNCDKSNDSTWRCTLNFPSLQFPDQWSIKAWTECHRWKSEGPRSLIIAFGISLSFVIERDNSRLQRSCKPCNLLTQLKFQAHDYLTKVDRKQIKLIELRCELRLREA